MLEMVGVVKDGCKIIFLSSSCRKIHFLPAYSRAALKQLFIRYINMYEKMFMTRLIRFCILVLREASKWISNANQNIYTSTPAFYNLPSPEREGR